MNRIFYLMIPALMLLAACDQKAKTINTTIEPHRPQIHFSPKAHWMNDPNGMVFLNGKYHLFYQHNPDSTVWGPMHWGHATSIDLVHWDEQPIALYPDSLGAIFSGSAVVDRDNTAGFGKDALVAIFTYHNQKLEDAKDAKHQYQGLAYSTDEGKTWTKFKGNPVLPNPGIYDFRDPKVQWLPEQKKWLMTLATKDRISFYSSPNLKQWTKESEFGQKLGAHGGVWECPDLMSFDYQGGKKWVLLVSINPGGPNTGSATQYFTGDFDGKTFTPADTTTRWIDYGPDNYAGVTWSNTGSRHIFLGWMSNWNYANIVPTQKWRSAMTIPRELTLQPGTGGLLLASQPVKEVEALATDSTVLKDQNFDGEIDLSSKVKDLGSQYVLRFSTDELKDYTIKLSNGKNEQVLIGYDATKKQYFIDRTKAGKTNFKEGFAARAIAPRQTTAASSTVTLVIDKASAELFADGGLTNMTAIFFPNEDFNKLSMVGSGLKVKDLKIIELRSALK